MKKMFISIAVLGMMALGLAAAPASAGSSHEGTQPATHMELKDANGTIICARYNTDPWTKPVAEYCQFGEYTEQLFDKDWRQIGGNTKVKIGDSDRGTVNVNLGSGATHVELKSGSTIECSAYNVPQGADAVAYNCPYGAYEVFEFDRNWNQMGDAYIYFIRERP